MERMPSRSLRLPGRLRHAGGGRELHHARAPVAVAALHAEVVSGVSDPLLLPCSPVADAPAGRGALEEITPIIAQLNHASMLAAAGALHAEGITFVPDAPGGAALARLPGRRVVAWQRWRPRLDGGGDEPPEDVPYVLVHLMVRFL